MVKAPQLPVSVPAFTVEETIERKARAQTVSSVFEALDTFNGAQLVDVHLWLAEHPVPSLDPVQIAMGTVNALKPEEFLAFMTALKQSVDPDLWQMITGDDDA